MPNTAPCRDCGAAMQPKNNALECIECGLIDRDATPPIESVRNLCPSCRHQLEPGHDEMGCHSPGCPCAQSFKVIVEPRDVLPNSGNCEACEKASGGLDNIPSSKVFTKDHRVHMIKDEKDGLISAPCGAQIKDAERTNVSESAWKNEGDYNTDGGCKSCGWGAPGTGHTSGYHKPGCSTLKKESDAFDKAQKAERGNADGWKSGNVQYGGKRYDYQAKVYDEGSQYGINGGRISKLVVKRAEDSGWGNPIIDFDRGWGVRPSSEHQPILDKILQVHNTAENANVARFERMCPDCDAGKIEDADGNDIKCPKCKGTGVESVSKLNAADDKGPFDQPNPMGCNGCDEVRVPLNKEGYCKRCAAEQGPRQNARPDFKATMAAFEAHCKGCAKCGPVLDAPAGAEASDARNLCPTGSQLLVADIENAHPLDDRAKEQARGMWDAASYGEKKKTLVSAGYSSTSTMEQKRWADLPADVQQKIMSEVFGLENGQAPATSKKCPDCDGPVVATEGVSGSNNQYTCKRCGKDYDSTELKNADKEWWCLTCGKAISAKDAEPGGACASHKTELVEKKNADDRAIADSDIQSAQRGLNMLSMSIPDLRDLIAQHQGKDMFASKVIVKGAEQMLASKRRMGAAENQNAVVSMSERENAGADAYGSPRA